LVEEDVRESQRPNGTQIVDVVGVFGCRLFFRARLTQDKGSVQLSSGRPLLFLPSGVVDFLPVSGLA